MNNTNEERIMYYDAAQRKFVVEEIPPDTNQTNDTSASTDAVDSNTAVHRVV